MTFAINPTCPALPTSLQAVHITTSTTSKKTLLNYSLTDLSRKSEREYKPKNHKATLTSEHLRQPRTYSLLAIVSQDIDIVISLATCRSYTSSPSPWQITRSVPTVSLSIWQMPCLHMPKTTRTRTSPAPTKLSPSSRTHVWLLLDSDY